MIKECPNVGSYDHFGSVAIDRARVHCGVAANAVVPSKSLNVSLGC
jgi:hypothetical protein